MEQEPTGHVEITDDGPIWHEIRECGRIRFPESLMGPISYLHRRDAIRPPADWVDRCKCSEGRLSAALVIDTMFDFRSDATTRDPDQSSPTLQRCHQLLWSKPLPGGSRFDLDARPRGGPYLHHRSDLGEFFLSSDSVIATFRGWDRTAELMQQLSLRDVEWFEYVGYTIGGMMIWPSNRVDGKHTINGARGMSYTTIADRMDLTLECIRRYYDGDLQTPLGPTLARYPEYFVLFRDFRGYVDFFLLQDLVTDEYDGVRFFTNFDDFRPTAVPRDLASYTQFRDASIAFVHARNRRIEDWAAQHLRADRYAKSLKVSVE